MANPILVTGAAGRVGGTGRTVTELLLKQDGARDGANEDERAHALLEMGGEVVVGDLLDLDSMHRVIAGCETMYFGMSVSAAYLKATVTMAAVARELGVSGQHVAKDSLPDEHPEHHAEPSTAAALAQR